MKVDAEDTTIKNDEAVDALLQDIESDKSEVLPQDKSQENEPMQQDNEMLNELDEIHEDGDSINKPPSLAISINDSYHE
jgi:hypothetical protein